MNVIESITEWLATLVMHCLIWYARWRAGDAQKGPRDLGALYFSGLVELLQAGLLLRDDSEVTATACFLRGIARMQTVLYYVKPKSDRAMRAVAEMLALNQKPSPGPQEAPDA